MITSTVSKSYLLDELDGEYITQSELSLTADGIYAEVSANYSDLDGRISTLSLTADGIESKVGNLESGSFGGYTLFQQLSNRFIFDGEYVYFNGALIITDNNNSEAFSIFHNQSDGTIYMWGNGDYSYSPVVIGNRDAYGNEQPIYLYKKGNDDYLVATRGWVLENNIARFG